MITLRNVQKTYKTHNGPLQVLKGVNLSIEQGEMVAIMGRSGVGKSTLLHLLSGLEKPTDGEILIGETRLNHLSKDKATRWRKQNIGYVLQKDALIDEITIYENIALPLKYANKTKKDIENTVKSLLEKIDLLDKQYEYPSNLSGGQSKRVAIARALANKPAIILADEPTGSLDIETEAEILSVFQSLNQEGLTLIIVTHDQTVANQCGRILVLNDGLIHEEK
ncbi:ABC transporter ATP-binding protein [Pradoshia sp.]